MYLGENRFVRLWQKDDPNERSYIRPNYNYNFTRLPVTPAKPPKPKCRKSSTAMPPTQVELQTAETLLELSGSMTAPPEQPPDHLSDAMDKIVGHLDVTSPPKMPPSDAADLMCQPVLHVETDTPTPQME